MQVLWAYHVKQPSYLHFLKEWKSVNVNIPWSGYYKDCIMTAGLEAKLTLAIGINVLLYNNPATATYTQTGLRDNNYYIYAMYPSLTWFTEALLIE